MLFGMVSVSGLVRARAEDATVEFKFSTMGFSDLEAIDEPITDDDGLVTLTFSAGTNTSNSPVYGNTGAAARIYGGNTLTISADSNITKIALEITEGNSNKPGTLVASVGSYDNGVWTGESEEVVFTRNSSGGHFRIKSVTVTLGNGGEQPDPFVKPTTPEEIVNAAYDLAPGDTLEQGPYTLTGVVTAVNEAYNTQFSNVTVTIVVGTMTDKPIKCFRMQNGSGITSGEGVEVVKTGDTITVTGELVNYVNNNVSTIEFDAKCTLDALVPGETPFVRPETPEDIVDAAYNLPRNATLEGGTYTLEGKVTAVDTPYSSEHNNVTVTIVVGDMTDKPIQCFRMINGSDITAGEGVEVVKVKDVITVTGTLKNYNGTVEFDSNCTLDALVSYQPHHYETPAEILEAAAELAHNEELEGGPYELTGKVTRIITEYSAEHLNITFMMEVLGQEIEAYRIKNAEGVFEEGKGVEILAPRDTVTVKGQIKKYYDTIEFVAGSTLEALEHSSARITYASVMLSDSIAVNFKVAENQIEDEDLEPVVTVTFNGETYELTGTLKNGKYEFIFANLTAAMMNDEMQVQLKLRRRNSEDPGTVTDEFTYSVAEYCYKALKLYKNDKTLRTLLVDLLIYGEKAQIYKEYKTDDLVTKNLTEEQLAWATAEVPELTNKTEIVDGGDGSIAIKAAGLNLTDGIIVRIKIAAADIYDVELSVDDGEYYIPSDKFIPAATEGQYYAFFRIANPTQLGTVHEFTFVNADDEAISKTLKYSAESYCASILAKCASGAITDEALQGIVEALAKYAYSVKAYASN